MGRSKKQNETSGKKELHPSPERSRSHDEFITALRDVSPKVLLTVCILLFGSAIMWKMRERGIPVEPKISKDVPASQISQPVLPSPTLSREEKIRKYPWRDIVPVIEANKLGTAQWFHPEGADDEHPARPAAVIALVHEDLNGNILPETVPLLHNILKVLTVFANSSSRPRIAWEGLSADTKYEPKGVHDLQGAPLPSSQVEVLRSRAYSDATYFEELLRGNPEFIDIFGNLWSANVSIHGTENPKTNAEFKETFSRLRTAITRGDEVLSFLSANGPQSYGVIDINGETEYTFGNTRLSREALITILQNYLANDSLMKGELAQQRERYVAQNIFDAEVIVMGAVHAQNFSRTFPENGRSVCVVFPTGVREYLEDYTREYDAKQRIAEMLLSQIRKKETLSSGSAK